MKKPTKIQIDAMKIIHEQVPNDCYLNDKGQWTLTKEGAAYLEEFVAMFLTDNYDHDLFGFDWVVKGSTIYIKKIKWEK